MLRFDPRLARNPHRVPFPFAQAPRIGAPRVAILLDLFEAEETAAARIAELACQTHRAWSLLVRDDGSRDGTADAARRAAAALPGRDIGVTRGPRRGTARNLLAALPDVLPGTAALAFATGRTRWLPGKLSRALARLSAAPSERPALYCGPVFEPSAIGLRTRRQGCATGFCDALAGPVPALDTMVLNAAALDRLRCAQGYGGPVPDLARWILLLMTGTGATILVDDAPMVVAARRPAPLPGLRHSLGALSAVRPLLSAKAQARTAALAAALALPRAQRLHCPSRADIPCARPANALRLRAALLLDRR